MEVDYLVRRMKSEIEDGDGDGDGDGVEWTAARSRLGGLRPGVGDTDD